MAVPLQKKTRDKKGFNYGQNVIDSVKIRLLNISNQLYHAYIC